MQAQGFLSFSSTSARFAYLVEFSSEFAMSPRPARHDKPWCIMAETLPISKAWKLGNAFHGGIRPPSSQLAVSPFIKSFACDSEHILSQCSVNLKDWHHGANKIHVSTGPWIGHVAKKHVSAFFVFCIPHSCVSFSKALAKSPSSNASLAASGKRQSKSILHAGGVLHARGSCYAGLSTPGSLPSTCK